MGILATILSPIFKYWDDYKANEKRRELLWRLQRNGDGRWDQKAYLKDLNEQKKKIRKEKALQQQDLKK